MARTYHVIDQHEATPNLRPHAKSSTWRGIAIATVTAALTGASGIIGSHWGGVTKDELKTALDNQAERIEAHIDAKVSAVEDRLSKHVDAKIDAAPVYQPPKRKGRRGE